MSLTNTNDLNTFLFFGCWNNINCKEDNFLYRDIVLYSIKELEKPIDTLYIAGDNWYNFLIENNEDLKNIIKKENNKMKDNELVHYLTPVLISGYYLLYDMKKDVYICVGNHDEVKDSQDDDSTANGNFISPRKDDCMIKTQKYFMSKIKNNSDEDKVLLNYNEQIPKLENPDENPIFKFISEVTSENEELYLENLDSKIDIRRHNDKKENEILLFSGREIGIKYSKNYIMIIINTNNLDLVYIANINQTITDERRKNDDKQIFVMGHFPLFFVKNNSTTKEDELLQNVEIAQNILDALYETLVINNCIYLCADCHNFNIMKISKKIDLTDYSLIQIMSGTGGADPDLVNEVIPEYDMIKRTTSNDTIILMRSETPINNYFIEYNTINSYGYCKIIVDKEIRVIYNKLISAEKNKEWKSVKDKSSIILEDKLNYQYCIKNNDVFFYKVSGDIVYSASKQNSSLSDVNNTEKIQKIAKSSVAYMNLYCSGDYMKFNHVIKNKDNTKVCFNRAYKIKKNKIGKKKKEDKTETKTKTEIEDDIEEKKEKKEKKEMKLKQEM